MRARQVNVSQIKTLLPLGVVGIVLLASQTIQDPVTDEVEGSWGNENLTTASALPLGYSAGGRNRSIGRVARRSREKRNSAVRKMRLRRPSILAKRKGEREITIEKSSAEYRGINFSKRRRSWKFLNRGIRRQIDSSTPRKNRWKVFVVHNSSTKKGNAKAFDYYHRKVKGMPNGLAYHFVIGNGSYSKDGEIEVGQRWMQQLNGGHLKSALQNKIALGICLVGDFNSQQVSRKQLQALDELLDYLKAKVGDIDITTHKQINISPTDCPGRYFPEQLVTGRRGK